MSIRTISFRTRAENIKQLDQMAADEKRDRTFILNKAIDSFLSSPTPAEQSTAAQTHLPDSSHISLPRKSKNRLSQLTPLDLINPPPLASHHSLLKEMVRAWEKDWSAL